MSPHSVAVVVDGFSGGVHLAPAFKRQNYGVIHVQSDAKIWEQVLPTFDFAPYERNFNAAEMTMPDLCAAVSAFCPVAVVAGTETGVLLADHLAEYLGVRGNGTRLSRARRNKSAMTARCERMGLAVGLHREVGSIGELQDWYVRTGLKRVVLKPLNSAGTDGVRFCENLEELAAAFLELHGTLNKLGFANESLLACEFLEGPEYFLNSVSFGGRVVFTDIWRYEKRAINASRAVYDRNLLCDMDGELEYELRAYVEKVVEALGIRWGPAHTEVILTSRGPRLVECGARVDGLSLPDVNREVMGVSPLDLTVEALTSSERDLADRHKNLRTRFLAQTVYLTSFEEGKLAAFPGRSRLEALPSFYQISMRRKVGDRIQKTTDYFSAPGFLTLIHADPAQLETDYRQIRQMENEGELFEIRGS